jgi:hypothetical protein
MLMGEVGMGGRGAKSYNREKACFYAAGFGQIFKDDVNGFSSASDIFFMVFRYFSSVSLKIIPLKLHSKPLLHCFHLQQTIRP